MLYEFSLRMFINYTETHSSCCGNVIRFCQNIALGAYLSAEQVIVGEKADCRRRNHSSLLRYTIVTFKGIRSPSEKC